MDVAMRIAERRIQDAVNDGEFDNLPGAGKPLVFENDATVPAELRMTYKILKNAGIVPPEVELRKQMLTIQDLIRCCEDPSERTHQRTRLSLVRLQLDTLARQSGRPLPAAYADRVYQRLENE